MNVHYDFLLHDMPYVSTHVVELHSVSHEVHFWRVFGERGVEYFTERNAGVFHGTERSGTQEYFTERTIDFTELT